MKVAAIDIGSNSIHMVIARPHRDGFEITDRAKEMVGLGRGTLSTGKLSDAAMDSGLRTLATFKRLAEEQGADPILAVATSAVREATNGGELVLRVWDQLGLQIDVITGSEEARLIYLAASHAIGFGSRRGLVIDIGGGSVEIVLGSGREPEWCESVKVGVLRLTEHFVKGDPPTAKEISSMERYLRRELAPITRRIRRSRPAIVVGSSGTLLNLTAMAAALGGKPIPKSLHNRPLRRKDLARVREQVLALDAEQRSRLPGLDRRRADIVPAGVVLTDVLLSEIRAKEMRACDWALREGILLDFLSRHAGAVRTASAVPDVRRRSVFQLAGRLDTVPEHGRHVARLALQLFDGTRKAHGLTAVDRELLEYAALLHDIGLAISHSKHHRHSHYLITHGELRGFTPEEVQVMAAVARFHKGAPPKPSHEDLAELSPDARRLVTQLTAILRVADGLDRSHHGIVRNVRILRRGGLTTLRLDTGRRDAALELWGAERKADLFERRFGCELRFETGFERPSGR